MHFQTYVAAIAGICSLATAKPIVEARSPRYGHWQPGPDPVPFPLPAPVTLPTTDLAPLPIVFPHPVFVGPFVPAPITAPLLPTGILPPIPVVVQGPFLPTPVTAPLLATGTVVPLVSVLSTAPLLPTGILAPIPIVKFLSSAPPLATGILPPLATGILPPLATGTPAPYPTALSTAPLLATGTRGPSATSAVTLIPSSSASPLSDPFSGFGVDQLCFSTEEGRTKRSVPVNDGEEVPLKTTLIDYIKAVIASIDGDKCPSKVLQLAPLLPPQINVGLGKRSGHLSKRQPQTLAEFIKLIISTYNVCPEEGYRKRAFRPVDLEAYQIDSYQPRNGLHG